MVLQNWNYFTFNSFFSIEVLSKSSQLFGSFEFHFLALCLGLISTSSSYSWFRLLSAIVSCPFREDFFLFISIYNTCLKNPLFFLCVCVYAWDFRLLHKKSIDIIIMFIVKENAFDNFRTFFHLLWCVYNRFNKTPHCRKFL